MACRAVRRLKACDTEPTAENVMSFPLGLFNKHENRKKGLIEPGVHIMVCIAKEPLHHFFFWFAHIIARRKRVFIMMMDINLEILEDH